MSEKFGLDWKKYPMKRTEKLFKIMLWEGERTEKEMKNIQGANQESKFR